MPFIIGASAEKFILMALAPLIFIIKTPYLSKALLWGGLYWLICYFCASFQDYIRFSTLGFLGMYIMTYIVYYNLVHSDAFSLPFFMNLIKGLIIAFGIVLILQQIAMLIGIHSFWPINLSNQFFLSLTKLPSLTMEPSHSARILTVAMLAYMRCIELENNGIKPSVKELFAPKRRWVTILFLWSMITMGSGTAFIGLGLLSLYFLTFQNSYYVIPVLIVTFFIADSLGLKQMNRATQVTEVSITGNVNDVQETDGSAASRIAPLINTFTKTDPTDATTWLGHGTVSKEYASKSWMRTTDKLGVIDQYGLFAFIISLIFAYTCMIRRFFSLESLIFLFLFGWSLGNIYYTWGAMMILTAIRYFQEQNEKGILDTNESNRRTNYEN
jgi:hypothetical protein